MGRERTRTASFSILTTLPRSRSSTTVGSTVTSRSVTTVGDGLATRTVTRLGRSRPYRSVPPYDNRIPQQLRTVYLQAGVVCGDLFTDRLTPTDPKNLDLVCRRYVRFPLHTREWLRPNCPPKEGWIPERHSTLPRQGLNRERRNVHIGKKPKGARHETAGRDCSEAFHAAYCIA